ncbi:MAG: sugar ABC transporter ATP-binding protein [Candidatus Anaerobiospirillum merdipullorum]|uniref:Ribose/galactose/methyl galactoside import ATP-binding protein n=1 Tax=Candidatus Anaerobiospirillum merdipullorum TaxID=2838450 RepID=A0A9E2KQ78_9GAMM|nr:sugar ABC transporter ATP-binding protein [Candidatus Anaerobiospirillum merdipullorum]
MTEYVLEMNNIVKRFPGVLALDHANLKVRPGTVHALMGENGAGKSTLMKCLFGLYHPDEGEIIYQGKKITDIPNTKAALGMGITMIHQELHPIRFRPVMENVWIGRFPLKYGFVDHAKMYQDTVDLFKTIGLNVDPLARAGTVSPSNLQLVEIARAISYNAKIIIMDEPTSSLTENEVEYLFNIINKLRAEGRSIIYISHKMEEILRISDDVTIMRDGKYVGTWAAKDIDQDFIIRKMVGRDMTNRFPPRESAPEKEVVLKVEHLSAAAKRSFVDVNFELHKGEILGIGGLVGAQRTELVESIFGLRPVREGKIYKNGQEIHIHSVRDAKKNGIALLTEERRQNGIFGILSILDNTVIAAQQQFAHMGVLDNAKRAPAAATSCKDLNVKMPNLETPIKNLSGGNQQKVLIARWLLTNSDIIIFDEPTRGIDVGAKYEIYTLMLDQIKQGKSIIMISSEMPELMGMSDRIMVMCEGHVTGFVDKEHFDQVEIMRLASSFK